MKKFFALILICTLCLALCACGQQAQAPETDGGVNIVATVFPAYDFARQIAGDDGNVTLLIPPGSEAHSYEPTPQDIIRIQGCDLLVCNGGESEAWLDEILGGMDREIPAVVMLDCVDALTEEDKDGMQVHEHHEHHDHDHDHHEADRGAALHFRILQRDFRGGSWTCRSPGVSGAGQQQGKQRIPS